ncbi:MAG: ATP-dependent DNA helicase RecG [[Eubacterium] sulci]|jgi:ATP-dependent DNA helicase recG|nr:ATP-dependent DNA helicase RecG [[Eubacterium] sulci]
MQINDSISVLKGVGPKKVEIFRDMGIVTIEDLALYFPKSYEDRRTVTPISELKAGSDFLIQARLVNKRMGANRFNKKTPLVLNVSDDSGMLEVVFFNGYFLNKLFDIGKEYVFYGRITENLDRFQIVHPEFTLAGSSDDIREIIPVYSLRQGISQKEMRRMQRDIKGVYSSIKEWIPEDIVKKNKLASLDFAISNMHFPSNAKKVLQSRYRLVFDELFTLETGLMYMKSDDSDVTGISIDVSKGDEFISKLPFELTSGQRESWNEIKDDLQKPKKMNRLLQGDVGSGKTIIAEAAMLSAAASGFQSVIMAPTELLARQHFDTFVKDLSDHEISPVILISSMKASDKRMAMESISSGKAKVIIATHAVLEENIVFKNLGLVITDEQHRFGVNQRRKLSGKGEGVNILVMTATPIPRTIAAILYGDLDISQIRTMPKGRKGIHTYKCSQGERNRVFNFVEKEMKAGRQAYVVAPLIEDSESIDAKSANAIFDELQDRFDDFNIKLVHGAMKSADKDKIMQDFASAKVDLLVSTTVIEVGINVPNASVMVIENAERFGLAQLHQLRGRVGRGSDDAYCFLMCYTDSELANARMDIMTGSMSGFDIAEEDLKLRGPGEIFGTRQHGLPQLKISDLLRHRDVLEAAMNSARELIERDSKLEKPESVMVKQKVKKMFGSDISIDL